MESTDAEKYVDKLRRCLKWPYKVADETNQKEIKETQKKIWQTHKIFHIGTRGFSSGKAESFWRKT